MARERASRSACINRFRVFGAQSWSYHHAHISHALFCLVLLCFSHLSSAAFNSTLGQKLPQPSPQRPTKHDA
ncbi:unnamed protein product [Periconia digitata]|uniref:Uncharacterized protein n=1 Tax=Periconia digitata TaxID=1303443 RepID=A0A9W4URC0_9PLEO|nr:unnamed protein product [Periconia digitata]